MMWLAINPAAGSPPGPSTFVPSQGNAEAVKFRAAGSGPKSYS